MYAHAEALGPPPRLEPLLGEPKVGGALDYDMIADAPEQVAAMKKMGHPTSHPTHATFTELRPHERLTLTHLVDFIPGVKPYESTARVEFSRAGDKVRMVITLDPMHSEEWTTMATMGWTSQLTKLDKRFGST